jgi:putative addiction module antidote
MILETHTRKIGNSVGILLPKEALAHLNVEEGAALYLTKAPDGSLRMTANNPAFAHKMAVAQKLSRRYRNALRQLAK